MIFFICEVSSAKKTENGSICGFVSSPKQRIVCCSVVLEGYRGFDHYSLSFSFTPAVHDHFMAMLVLMIDIVTCSLRCSYLSHEANIMANIFLHLFVFNFRG